MNLTNSCSIKFHSKLIWYCASTSTGYCYQYFFQYFNHFIIFFLFLYCKKPSIEFLCSPFPCNSWFIPMHHTHPHTSFFFRMQIHMFNLSFKWNYSIPLITFISCSSSLDGINIATHRIQGTSIFWVYIVQ